MMSSARSRPVDPDSLYELVVDVIAETRGIPRSQISPEGKFVDLGIDSMAALGVLFALEERAGVVIPDEMARAIGSAGEAVEALLTLVHNDNDDVRP